MIPQMTLCGVTSAHLDALLSVSGSDYATAADNLPLTVLVGIPLNPPSFNNAAAAALPPTETLKLTSGSQAGRRGSAGAARRPQTPAIPSTALTLRNE